MARICAAFRLLLGARPSLRPRRPDASPPTRRGAAAARREAGSGHVNQPRPPAFRLHLPSLPPLLQKIKAEKEREKEATDAGTRLQGGSCSDPGRPHFPDPARRRTAGAGGGPSSRPSPGPHGASATLRLSARVGAVRPRTSPRPSGPPPGGAGQSCANCPTAGKYSPAAAGPGGAGVYGSLRPRSHAKGGRRRKGRELQWRRSAALGLGCAARFWLRRGLCCNKGLPLPHSRACRTALSRPRLRGDSGSAHQLAAASASLPLPLARPPTPPLAARGTRGRLFVATSFCVGR